MLRCLFMIISAVALSACTETPSASEDTQKFWDECNFELSKVEIGRGRNLDDLNKGIAVARNQFLVDCMASKTPKFLPHMMEDLSRYAKDKSRQPSDLMTNRVN